MANKYNKRPSEILNIENDYLAYCFDEVSLWLEAEATGEDRSVNWDKIKWKDKTRQTNEDLMSFIKGNS